MWKSSKLVFSTSVLLGLRFLVALWVLCGQELHLGKIQALLVIEGILFHVKILFYVGILVRVGNLV